MLRRSLLTACLIFCLAGPSPAADAPSSFLTTENIAKFSPRARADLVDSLVRNRAMLDEVEINTRLRFLHFMAQIAAETGGFVRLDENMNYSADGLLATFRKYVRSREVAYRLARRPVAIANFVYGHRLGNFGRHTNDGWNYRGSGFIQLTGRGNFRDRGNETDLDLEGDPELARHPTHGLKAAVAYWDAREINPIAETDNIEAVRRAVNGGLNGLSHAKLWYARARKVFGPQLGGLEAADIVESAHDEELEAAKELLIKMGFMEESQLEAADADTAFEKGIEELQRAYGLADLDDQGGVNLESAEEELLPEDVLYVVTDPQTLVQEREGAE